MRLSSIVHLYRVRLKARTVLGQELLAVLGLAVGVALLFASQVSSASLNNSVGQLTRELVGNSQLQLEARGPADFDQRLLAQVAHLTGVRAVAPLLEQTASLVGPSGRRGVQLIGVEPRFALKASHLSLHFRYAQVAHLDALAIPSPLAHAIGVAPLEAVQLQLGGKGVSALVGAELGSGSIGALAASPIVVAPLSYAQRLSGKTARLTRIFIKTAPGAEQTVRQSLLRIAGDSLDVEPADFDATLFSVAAAPINQGESLFAGISALVGFLFAFNAMLLTLPLRQALVRSLRANGATRAAIAATLLFDAVMLALAAAALGLLLGDALSLLVFGSSPGYLSFAFPVGSQRVVSWHSIAVATGAGMLAACIGVLASVRGTFARGGAPSTFRASRSRAWAIGSLALGLACLALTTAILLARPQAAVLGSVILLAALLLMLPLLLDALVAAFERLQSHFSSAATRLAVVEIRSPRTRVRAQAIAATAAIGVFGSVAIQGAQSNLQHGVDRVAHNVTRAADVWIVPGDTEDLLGTAEFAPTRASAIARVPGVRAVGAYRAGFLNFSNRRVWVIAPSPTAPQRFPSSQLLRGNLATTAARLTGGGWAVLSQALAAQQHLHIGEAFTLPSQRPRRLRVAALSTNLSWPPGAIVLSPGDYARAFGSTDIGAYNVMLARSANMAQVQRRLREVLGPGSALAIESGRQREQRFRATSRQGSSRLSQIALLVLIATTISIAVAMVTMLWQRRARLARMKVQGYSREVLWRALLVESALLLGAGCLIGAAFGIFGQLLISHALASVTGFPVVFTVGARIALTDSSLVSAIALLIVALPGHRAAGVPAYA
ncbi:MAG: ABC transporter permease [Solirubrobacteraceae bacterium]